MNRSPYTFGQTQSSAERPESYPPTMPERTYHPAWWLPGPHLRTLWGKDSYLLTQVRGKKTLMSVTDAGFDAKLVS